MNLMAGTDNFMHLNERMNEFARANVKRIDHPGLPKSQL